MNIFSLLGKIMDDARGGLVHFDCWNDNSEVVYDCCTDYITDDVYDFITGEMKDGCAIVFRADTECNFEIAEINYINKDGMEMSVDVREYVRKDMMSDNLLSVYHDLCEKIVELS